MANTKKTVEKTVEAAKVVAKKATAAVKDVKETVEKDPTVLEAVKEVKETAQKVADETKKTVKKAATKKAGKPVVKEVYVQFAGKEVRQSDLLNMVTEAYIAEGHSKSDIKEIEMYVKPEDSAAYYVINGTDTGKVNY